MSSNRFVIDGDALRAFADGQLDAAQRAEVERYLAEHPEAAADMAAWMRQNDALKALFPLPDAESTPARLSVRQIERGLVAARRHSLRNIAAALLLLAIGSGIGWFGRDYLSPGEAASDRLIDAAVTAHSLYVKEKTRAVEVKADQPNLMSWLSSRIATSIDAPSLAEEGFTFIGGRLLPSDPGDDLPSPAAQLMYENGSAQRLTLYVTAALPDKQVAWSYESRGGVEAYYWANDEVTCTIVGDFDEEELRALGRKAFAQLTRRTEPARTAG